MEEDFKGKCLDSLNKFRMKPISIETKLKNFVVFNNRIHYLAKQEGNKKVDRMQELIDELPNMKKLPKFQIVPELNTIAESELKKYMANKKKYKHFQTGTDLNGVIGQNLDENSCSLVANESLIPEDTAIQVLLDMDDEEGVGYYAMRNKEFVEVGIACKYDEDEEQYDYILLFAIPGALSDQLDTDIDLSELKEAFDLFDYKKRGLINTHSIEQVLLNLGWADTENGVYNIMKDLDQQKGKKVNFNTFAKFILDYIAVRTEDDDYIRRVFNLYRDDVKNDTVTLYTMREVAKDLQCDICLKYLNEVYGDQEGKDIILTFEEFRDFMHGKYGKATFSNNKKTTVTKKTVAKTVKK